MVWRWSKVAASNSNADTTINWAEGQAPSSINDSARAEMARVAQYRDDIAGAIVTTGTSTAYAVSSNQVFDTLAHMDGAMIAFTPHATNTGAVTLNIDSLGARGLRSSPGVDLPSGSLILGTPYVALYNNSDAVWYLHGGVSNPYNIPLGGGIDYWGTTAPNSAFAFPSGQAISRTTYATCFTLLGTTFGAGDGSTTFNLPDKRGRVSAAWDAMGGTSASRFSPAFGTGAGTETVSIAQGNLPALTLTGAALSVSASGTTGSQNANHQHAFSGTTGDDSPDHAHGHTAIQGANVAVNTASASATAAGFATANIPTAGANARHQHAYAGATASENANHQHAVTVTGTTSAPSVALGGSGTALANVQPTIVCNYILRII
jgi:microcystin-dependent protein